MLALDEALERLQRLHPGPAEVVLLRHFAGLSVEEAASELGRSTATVKRQWRFARSWLLGELGGAGTAIDESKGFLIQGGGESGGVGSVVGHRSFGVRGEVLTCNRLVFRHTRPASAAFSGSPLGGQCH